MTNYHWQFSIEHTRAKLGFETLLVVNDFTALAMALPHLTGDQKHQVGGGHAVERSVLGLVGAGTGLGVSALIPADDGWVSLGTEGGHVAFSPQDAREVYVLEYAWKSFSHVSAERLVSGSGIELIYRALADRAKARAEAIAAPEITRRGLQSECAICVETLEVFCAMLGTVAANIAVTLGAFGGVYIGGRIVPSLGDYFDASPFRERFEAKGRFTRYVANIPTYVITADAATFAGTSAILEAQLRKHSTGHSIVDRIRQMRAGLTPSERRVADLILAQPRSVLNDPIVGIARNAEVSQPTVIRFCRSMGCQGLSDFKLKLASGLTGTIPVTHTQVTGKDSSLELGAKVLGNTASAVLQVRDQLNRESIDQAIDLLLGARRIEFYGVGNYGIVAQDAQYKFLRFGVSTVAYTDPRLQLMAAAVLSPQDVVVVVSSSGKITELLEVVDRALASGAAVIAITASQSPLAKRATVTIIVDHSEDITTQIPMISRILHLLIIDILAVGVAMRRSGMAIEDLDTAALEGGKAVKLSRKPGKGRSATDLARLTSHSR